ncbi:MAG: hypothetical protein EXS67_01060 [Candidatus Margulisbacteria bacterium]|nr:hypothetical protein [Candidatus Margulisiibacteriota bacterium]
MFNRLFIASCLLITLITGQAFSQSRQSEEVAQDLKNFNLPSAKNRDVEIIPPGPSTGTKRGLVDIWLNKSSTIKMRARYSGHLRKASHTKGAPIEKFSTETGKWIPFDPEDHATKNN